MAQPIRLSCQLCDPAESGLTLPSGASEAGYIDILDGGRVQWTSALSPARTFTVKLDRIHGKQNANETLLLRHELIALHRYCQATS